MKFTETWQEVANKWSAGDIVWSASLGGIGPGYEQCIQNLLFEILVVLPKDTKFKVKKGSNEYPEEYSRAVDYVARKLDNENRFSGSQVAIAKATAFQFIHYGYANMMNKLPKGRLIQVNNPKPPAVMAGGVKDE